MRKNKVRPPRIDREHEEHIEDESGHLWAISYADFLMVLLSFFVLFFSVDEDKKKSVIRAIVDNEFQEGTGESGGEGNGPGAGAGEGTGKQSGMGEIRSLFDKFNLQTEKTKESLLIRLPTDIYPVGHVNLPAEEKARLTEVLERLKPYMEQIEIIFIGHTDSVPITKSKAGFLNNNFDLSVLRASKALQHALRLELPARKVSAQGAANGDRDTRSLSILIRAKN